MAVDLNSRYSSAWFEVNTRLTLRQSALSVYVSLISIVLVGIGLSKASASGAVVATYLPLLVPILSLGLAMQLYMHDKIIINLCNFIMLCEQLENPDPQTPQNQPVQAQPVQPLPLPSYLANDQWYKTDLDIRQLHHYSVAIIIVVFNILAYLAANAAQPGIFYLNSASMWILISMTIASVILVLYSSRIRRRGGARQAYRFSP